jgi:hypothetical protein
LIVAHPNLVIRAEEPPPNFNNLRDVAARLATCGNLSRRSLTSPCQFTYGLHADEYDAVHGYYGAGSW